MKKTSLKKNFIYNVAYELLILILPLITSPYLTRAVGAQGLGVVSYSHSLAQYFILFIMLGLKNYGNREIAKVRDDQKKLDQTFSEIFSFQFFMMLLVSSVYVGFVLLTVKEDRLIYWLQYLYVLSAGFDVNWCCFGLEKFKLTVTRNTIIKIASAAAIFLFVKTPGDAWKYALILSGSMLLSNLVIWPFVLKYVHPVKPELKGVTARIRPNLMLFLPVVAISLYTIMDKLMLGFMDTKTEVAYYTYAERIIQIPLSMITALGTVMLPRVSNMMQTQSREKTEALMVRSMQFAMFLSIGSTFGVMAVANDLIPWYYGEDFTRCAVFTAWLAPVIALTSWNTIIRTQYVIPRGLDRLYLITVSSGAVVNVVMNSILIPRMQGTGAVIGTLAAQSAVCFMQYLLLRGQVNFRKFCPDTLSFVLFGGIMFAVVVQIPEVTSVAIVNIMVRILAGVVCYCVCAFAYLLLIRKDRWLFGHILKMIPGRRK